MTGHRKDNPTRHRSSVPPAGIDGQHTSSETEGSATGGRSLPSQYPNSDCSPQEDGSPDDGLWIVELLNQLDRERDALRTKPKPAPAFDDGKMPHALKPEVTDCQTTGEAESIDKNRETFETTQDERPACRPIIPNSKLTPDRNRRTTWPYILYVVVALTATTGIATLREFGAHQVAQDTATAPADHSTIAALTDAPPAASSKILQIPHSEIATVLVPEDSVRTDGSPVLASLLSEDSIELAAIVSSPDVSLATLAPRPARISLPQGPPVRSVVPPKPIMTDSRISIDVMPLDAHGGESAAIVPSPGSLRMETPQDITRYHEAYIPEQAEPANEDFKSGEHLKYSEIGKSEVKAKNYRKLRRKYKPSLPHTVKASRRRSFALPFLLRPTAN